MMARSCGEETESRRSEFSFYILFSLVISFYGFSMAGTLEVWRIGSVF
jgi:hypothetical protein